MDIKPILVAVVILFSASAHGQVFKCKNAQGKMEYSDTACHGAVDTGIQNNPSASARPGYDPSSDPNARALQMLQTDRAKSDAKHTASKTCIFQYLKVGDPKGIPLARAAKEECLRNAELKASGQPISLDAYNAWKQNFDMIVSRIQAAETAAAANRAAAAAESANRKLDNLENSSYRCRRSYGNDIGC